MKYAFASAIAAVILAGVAVAQTTPSAAPTADPLAAPAGPVAPSSCPAYPTAPTLPGADLIKNQRDLDAAGATANGHIAAFNTVHTCRLAEIATLKAQFDKRASEAREGQQAVLAFSEAWKTTGAAVVARSAEKQKDNRSGRK